MKRILLFILLLIATSAAAQAPNPPQVKLSWDASPATCVTGYNVYRSTTSGTGYTKLNANPVPLATATAPFVDAAGLVQGTTYYYVVKAFCPPVATGATGESGPSNEVSAAIPNGLQPLPAPTGIMLTCSADGKSVTAKWNAVPTATDYWTRARYTDDGSMIAEATKDGGNAATQIVFAVVPGREVDFWVHSFNAANPPADPTWPMGVGNYGSVKATCNAPIPPPPNLKVVFVTPVAGAILNRPDTVLIQLEATNAKTVSLFIDRNKVALSPTLSYRWKPTKRGVRTLTAKAWDAEGTAASISEMVTVQ